MQQQPTDSAIIFFSGMGPNAQEELSVGVGALAGSTIFLLTIPWSMCIAGGRVHIDPVSALALYKCVAEHTNTLLQWHGVALH